MFRQFILKIDCDDMAHNLDKNDNIFASSYQKVLILKIYI